MVAIRGVQRMGGKRKKTRIIKGNKVIPIDTRSPPKNMFNKRSPDRPEILLCAEHCSILRIDLNSALRHLRHGNARFIYTGEK